MDSVDGKMRSSTVLLLLAATLTSKSFTDASYITCVDLKNIPLIGSFFVYFSSIAKSAIPINIYLSTNYHPEPIHVNLEEWINFDSAQFNPNVKSFFIIHGFKSGGQKKWVLQMKDAILATRKANIFMVDWSKGSNKKNYVSAAKNTQHASNEIFNYLQRFRFHVQNKYPNAKNIQWNQLYFIGHSLGAQISGQVSHLLKEDSFWKIVRISGLDPAKPCFRNIDNSLKLDKSDADFVDIIHTQIGTGESDSLGLTDSIGHMDFYVNGGMTQPECTGGWFGNRVSKMICSHKLAYKLFTESFYDSKYNCAFTGQRWNGSYEDAQRCLTIARNGLSCSSNDCPKMGIDADKSNARGIFVVYTGIKEPHCKIESNVNSIVKVIRKLKGIKSIFDMEKPSVTNIRVLNT